MHLSKLTHVLQKFDEAQFKQLKRFIHSSYFHHPISAVILFDYLETCYPLFPEKKLHPDVIATRVENLHGEGKQRKAGTELIHAIEHFVSIEYWSNSDSHKTRHRLAGLLHSGQRELFRENMLRVETQDPPENLCDVEHFHHRHRINDFEVTNRLITEPGMAMDAVHKAMTSLDEFHAYKKLRYLCECCNRQIPIDKVLSQNQLALLVETLSPYYTEKVPSVYIYLNIFYMQSASSYDEAMPHYQLLKEFALEHEEKAPTELINALEYISQSVIRWVNQGYLGAEEEYLWWAEWKMRNGWMLTNGMLSQTVFRNVLIISMHHRPLSWICDFAEQALEYLPDVDRENCLNFAQGILSFIVGKYKEALTYFQQTKADESPTFLATLKRWEWMSLYEYDSTDIYSLKSHLENFERYIKRNESKLNPNAMAFRLFTKQAKALLTSKPQLKGTYISSVEQSEYFPGKRWIGEKWQEKLKR